MHHAVQLEVHGVDGSNRFHPTGHWQAGRTWRQPSLADFLPKACRAVHRGFQGS